MVMEESYQSCCLRGSDARFQGMRMPSQRLPEKTHGSPDRGLIPHVAHVPPELAGTCLFLLAHSSGVRVERLWLLPPGLRRTYARSSSPHIYMV
eukprot:6186050-Pleurochrysis_carterae.AAC.1